LVEVEGSGGVQGDGPYIRLIAEFDGTSFGEVRCLCNGCATAVAMCNMLGKTLSGRELSRVETLMVADVNNLFPTLPEGKETYKELAYQSIVALRSNARRTLESEQK